MIACNRLYVEWKRKLRSSQAVDIGSLRNGEYDVTITSNSWKRYLALLHQNKTGLITEILFFYFISKLALLYLNKWMN